VLQLVHLVAVYKQVIQFSLQFKQIELFNPVSYFPILHSHVKLLKFRVSSQVKQFLDEELQVLQV